MNRLLTIAVFASLSCTQAPAASSPAPVQPAAAPPAPAATPGSAAIPAMSAEQTAARNDSLNRDRQMHLDRIREQIRGKDSLPAEDVFQNVKTFPRVQAGRFLAIMNRYSNSLGVSCSHCHVTSDFAKEDKPEKQIARDMVHMVGAINDSLLRRIPNIKSENPSVGCSTCHAGRPRPGAGGRG